MANTRRRYFDSQGKMFIPMNLEGGAWNENFITTGKLFTIAGLLASTVLVIAWMVSKKVSFTSAVMISAIYLFCLQLVVRYVVFEEKFYYRMYQKMKTSEITTPAIFWDIVGTGATSGGLVLAFSDGKIAVLVKFERDTIIGKEADFEENHYDSVSEFYRQINMLKYSFVQMNLMEPAGNDSRISELDKLVSKSDNKNIRYLMERQIGYIKNITRESMYESDYFLIYTKDLTRVDQIVEDVNDCAYTMLTGAYISFKFLNQRDVVEIVKDIYGVKYFSYSEAEAQTERMGVYKKPFELYSVIMGNGKQRKFSKQEINKVRKLTSEKMNNGIVTGKITVREAVFEDESKIKKGNNALGEINSDTEDELVDF